LDTTRYSKAGPPKRVAQMRFKDVTVTAAALGLPTVPYRVRLRLCAIWPVYGKKTVRNLYRTPCQKRFKSRNEVTHVHR